MDITKFASAADQTAFLQQRAQLNEKLENWYAAAADWLRLAALSDAHVFGGLAFAERYAQDGQTKLTHELLGDFAKFVHSTQDT